LAAAPERLDHGGRYEPAPEAASPVDLDALAARWQHALTAAERSLSAAGGTLPPFEVRERRLALARERRETADLLVGVAKGAGVEPAPWLSPVALRPSMLGLPPGVRGCLFDLEGVLTDAARLHAWAWAAVLDPLLERMGEKIGIRLEPFGAADYGTYLDGRTRLEGIHAFLASRGISLPEGDPGDPAEAETAHGLARRKGDAVAGGLQPHGVTALAGARRYLAAAGQSGLARAVVSASSSTLAMLELAGLGTLVDERVDADVLRLERLRARPAPDLLEAACRRLGVACEDAVTFTHSPAGVAAGLEAGLIVVGVGSGAEGDALAATGATSVVPSLEALLDAPLREPAANGRPPFVPRSVVPRARIGVVRDAGAEAQGDAAVRSPKKGGRDAAHGSHRKAPTRHRSRGRSPHRAWTAVRSGGR
jgi:beta-phosphoglucomutase-like phosphatase (HAD superfamily)